MLGVAAAILPIAFGTAHAEEAAEIQLKTGVDYSKCIEFMHGFDSGTLRGYKYLIPGPFLRNTLHYYPFRLQNDGRIKVSPDGDRAVGQVKEWAQGKATHRLDYPTPRIEHLRSSTFDSVEGKPDRARLAYLTITELEDGFEVMEDFNLSPAEREASSHTYRGAFTYDKQGFVWTQTRTVFSFDSDECVPLKRSHILTHRDDSQRKSEVTVFYTPLCREIKDFIERDPRMELAFDDELNDEVNNVFARHIGSVTPQDGSEPFLKRGLETRSATQLLSLPSPIAAYPRLSAVAALGAYYNSDTSDQIRRLHGRSAVIVAHQVLANCYRHGLGHVLDNQSDVEDVASGGQ